MLVHPRSAALALEVKPVRDPRKVNRTGVPLDAKFREVAA
jgi:hypothetical protein